MGSPEPCPPSQPQSECCGTTGKQAIKKLDRPQQNFLCSMQGGRGRTIWTLALWSAHHCLQCQANTNMHQVELGQVTPGKLSMSYIIYLYFKRLNPEIFSLDPDGQKPNQGIFQTLKGSLLHGLVAVIQN